VQNLLFSIFLSRNIKIKGMQDYNIVCCCVWSNTLREERRLRVTENRVLRKMFGHKRDEVTGKRTKLHIEELSDLYSSPNIFSGD